MDIIWNVSRNGLIANETEGYLTFTDEEGTFFFFIVGVYPFDDSEQRNKLITEIKEQIVNGDESASDEKTEIIIDNEDSYAGFISDTGEGIFSIIGFKIGSSSITKFASTFEKYNARDKVISIIRDLKEEK